MLPLYIDKPAVDQVRATELPQTPCSECAKSPKDAPQAEASLRDLVSGSVRCRGA